MPLLSEIGESLDAQATASEPISDDEVSLQLPRTPPIDLNMEVKKFKFAAKRRQ